MRILLDEELLDWDSDWDITVRTLAYTTHTLMPEALEKWSLPMLQKILPRHMQIIYEINHRFLQQAVSYFPLQPQMLGKISIIEESNPKQVRMANLAIIGSHSTNGVAALHSELLKKQMFPQFNLIFPDRFNNKTNGITQRRWLLAANPKLADLIKSAIGDAWITDFSKISDLTPFAQDKNFLLDFKAIKEENKVRSAAFLKAESGMIINPHSFFDVQVKRIHEYKRQLLNALNILLIYNDLKNGGEATRNMESTTFLFGGKAAPGYVNAKLIIKLINNIAKIDRCGSCNPRPSGHLLHAQLSCFHGGNHHSRHKPQPTDFHSRNRGIRNRKHEVHVQRSTDHWYDGRCECGNCRGSGSTKHVHLRQYRRTNCKAQTYLRSFLGCHGGRGDQEGNRLAVQWILQCQ